MQREIERRQSRRGLGLGAELGGLGEGAAADAAARDAAGEDTEEEKQNEDLQPLEDLDEDRDGGTRDYRCSRVNQSSRSPCKSKVE